jgi:MFS transporter, YNFM family, putative membrane transport protein
MSSPAPAYRRTNRALFFGGFSCFALLYCVQPLMPVFARDFHVSPSQSSLSLSLTSGLLAPTMILVGAFSEARGRKAIMVVSLFASAVITLLSAFATQWNVFLAARALAGITFAGLPAISMAYLSEEMHPTSIGLAMGLAIGGNGLGGMIGRLLASFLADVASWRWAMGIIGVIGLVGATIFWRTLPPSRHFVRRPLRPVALLTTFIQQFRDVRLLALFAEGFLLMGAFVTTYNYATYHLLDAPYLLSQSATGLIFFVYIGGVFASAWIGSLADRVGRGRMLVLMLALMLLGVGFTALRPLPFVVLGIATVTFGFFGGHSVASSWVGLHAHNAKAQASALYLFFYYVGSSLAGGVGGLFWEHWRWTGVAGFVAGMVVLGLAIAPIASRERGTLAHA